MTEPIVPGDLFARTQTITGLRALADFLEANPAVPVNEFGWTVTVHADGTDAEERAEVNRIAELLNVTPTDETEQGRHYRATKSFGRITYETVHIPARRMDDYRALMSYRPAFMTETTAR
jgi:hypothetical protein